MVLEVDNVNQALVDGINLLKRSGITQPSRDGDVITAPFPVTTVYKYPQERVLFHPERDTNPFFHLFESMWMIAGSEDGKFLDLFVKGFSERFGQPDGVIWGAYGHRWRVQFDTAAGGQDQLQTAIDLLKENNNSRQVVVTMWNPGLDFGAPSWIKDRPCNTHIYFRIRHAGSDTPELDMTVCCRSNDIIMGAYGANAVHMSVLQEYIAAGVGVPVGKYYQISNDYHMYLRDMDKVKDLMNDYDHYAGATDISSTPLFHNHAFNSYRSNTEAWMDWVKCLYTLTDEQFASSEAYDFDIDTHDLHLFKDILLPMTMMHRSYRAKDFDRARVWGGLIHASDWQLACQEWLARRVK